MLEQSLTWKSKNGAKCTIITVGIEENANISVIVTTCDSCYIFLNLDSRDQTLLFIITMPLISISVSYLITNELYFRKYPI